MEYLAHTKNEQGVPHLLKDHLIGTAELMKNFCFIQELKEIFYLTGLLHDFGKYQTAFQNYLINGGIRGSVPHARWGTYYLGKKFPEIAFVINGHHKGLPNIESLKADFNLTEKEIVELEKLKSKFNNEIGKIEVIENNQFIKNKSKSERELIIRYLFSCLTDSDWLDTEKHADIQKNMRRICEKLEPIHLITKLNNHLDGLSKTGEINILRNHTRNYALSRASHPQGFFSMNLPTGLGKTLTSVAWALEHAKKHNLKRLIIVLPFISIIDQTATELKKIFGENLVLEHHSSFELEDSDIEKNDANISIISKRLAFENWDYPIIVTTSVQFFESIFSNKTKKCRKLHRIAESVIIFDEIQTLKKELVLPTLEILEDMTSLLRCSFLFCTATEPAFREREGFKGIKNLVSLVDNPKELFKQTERVNYFLLKEGKELDTENFIDIVSKQAGSKLIVVNTKKTALRIFNKLISNDNSTHYMFLSTDLCPADRKEKIKKIRQKLKNNVIITLVSTQLIEAGVDFDFPCVYREIAPMESLIQAAGRCNREGKMKDKGKVYIFRLSEESYPDTQYKNLASFCFEKIKENISVLHDYTAYEKYYEAVLELYIDGDKYSISQNRALFKFEDVANSYKLIDQATKPLFILNYNKDSAQIGKEIESRACMQLPITKELYQKIQQFSVNVYPNFLIDNKCYVQMQNEILVWVGKYNKDTGIKGEQFTVNDLIT